MTRHSMVIGATFLAALAISVSAPARTAPEKQLAWNDTFADTSDVRTIESARVQAMLGSSVHAIHAGF